MDTLSYIVGYAVGLVIAAAAFLLGWYWAGGNPK